MFIFGGATPAVAADGVFLLTTLTLVSVSVWSSGWERWRNSEYVQFISLLEQTKKNNTPENKVRSLHRHQHQTHWPLLVSEEYFFPLWSFFRKSSGATTLTFHTGPSISAGLRSAVSKYSVLCRCVVWCFLLCHSPMSVSTVCPTGNWPRPEFHCWGRSPDWGGQQTASSTRSALCRVTSSGEFSEYAEQTVPGGLLSRLSRGRATRVRVDETRTKNIGNKVKNLTIHITVQGQWYIEGFCFVFFNYFLDSSLSFQCVDISSPSKGKENL